MIAKLKYLSSPDTEDLKNFRPIDPENFSILIQIHVGSPIEDGNETFDIEICTPKWLLSNYKKTEIILGRHMVLVFEYNFQRLEDRIKKIISSSSGNTWSEIAEKLSKWAHWEFEGYVDYNGKAN